MVGVTLLPMPVSAFRPDPKILEQFQKSIDSGQEKFVVKGFTPDKVVLWITSKLLKVQA